jgi:hypothetical protein
MFLEIAMKKFLILMAALAAFAAAPAHAAL